MTCELLARPAGLEPATPDLEGRCSIQMSYGRVTHIRTTNFVPRYFCAAFCLAHRLFWAAEIAARALADIFRRFLPLTMMMPLASVAPAGRPGRRRPEPDGRPRRTMPSA